MSGEYTPAEWHQQMFAEVKVAYRLIGVCGSPDVDAQPYDAELVAEVDAEYDRWLAEVQRAAAEKALNDAADAAEQTAEAYAKTSESMARIQAWEDSSRYSNYSAGLSMAATALRKRAATHTSQNHPVLPATESKETK